MSRGQRSTLALISIPHAACGSLLGTVMALYIEERGSSFAMSLVYAVFSFGLLVFAPAWDAIADITGRRRATLIGTALLSTLAVTPLTVTTSIPLQIAYRGPFAAFTADFQSVILTIVSESGGGSEHGRSIGFYSSARSSGAISGRLFVGYLVGLLVPTDLYLVVVGLGLVATLLTLRTADPTPPSEETLTTGRLLGEIRGRLFPGGTQRELFERTGLGWLYVGIVLRNTTEKGFIPVVPVFLIADVGLSNVVMGAAFTVSLTVQVVSMYDFGRLSDSISREKLIVGGLVGSGVQALVVVLALVPDGQLARIGISSTVFVAHVVTFSMLTVGTIAFVAGVAPVGRESELMGLRSTTRGLDGVLGPLLVGVLATRFDCATAFVYTSVLAFVAAGLVGRTLAESFSPE